MFWEKFSDSNFASAWATIVGSALQVVAVYWAAKMGFKAQKKQHKRQIKADARSVASPIIVELRDVERRLRVCAYSICINKEICDSGEYDITHLENLLKHDDRIFECLLPNIGIIGGYSAHIVCRNYKNLEGMLVAASKKIKWCDFFAAACVIELMGREVRSSIDVLRAVEALGPAEEDKVTAWIKQNPSHWTAWPKMPDVPSRVDIGDPADRPDDPAL